MRAARVSFSILKDERRNNASDNSNSAWGKSTHVPNMRQNNADTPLQVSRVILFVFLSVWFCGFLAGRGFLPRSFRVPFAEFAPRWYLCK